MLVGNPIPHRTRSRPESPRTCESHGKVPWHIFQEDEAGSYSAEFDSEHLGPKMSLVVCPPPTAGKGKRLAWISTADEVDRFKPRRVDRSDISVPLAFGPMLFEDCRGVFVFFNLPLRLKAARPFEAKFDSADSGEARSNGYFSHLRSYFGSAFFPYFPSRISCRSESAARCSIWS